MGTIIFEEVSDTAGAIVVARLAREIWPEHYTSTIGEKQVAYMVDRFQSSEAILLQIQRGERYFLIRSDEPVGYLSFAVDLSQGSLFLSKLYLKACARGKGWGRAAIDFVAKQAGLQGREVLTLTVNKKNTTSIDFYERCGFVKVKDVVKDIGAGFVMDDWMMEKKLARKDMA